MMTELERTIYDEKPQSIDRTLKCIKENFASKTTNIDVVMEIPSM
jgi:hypothetical protein